MLNRQIFKATSTKLAPFLSALWPEDESYQCTNAQFIRRAAAVPNQIGRIKFGSSTVAARRMNRAELIKFGTAVLTTLSADSSTLARW